MLNESGNFVFDFLKYRRLSLILSVIVFGAGLTGLYIHKDFKYSVDFTGGMEVIFRFKDNVSRKKLRGALEKDGWENVILRDFSKKDM